MKLIPLSGAGGGYSAIVDDDDYEWLSKLRWYAVKTGSNKQYVAVKTQLLRVWDDGFTWGRAEQMHRLILGRTATLNKDIHVDHINGNSLDNRKENLRTCSRTENARNSKKRITHNGKPCSSKYKGVMWYPWNKMLETGTPWNAQIRHNNKLHNLGYFATEEMAAKAYDAMAVTLFGEYARTNF